MSHWDWATWFLALVAVLTPHGLRLGSEDGVENAPWTPTKHVQFRNTTGLGRSTSGRSSLTGTVTSKMSLGDLCGMDETLNKLANVKDWRSHLTTGTGVQSIKFPRLFNMAFEFAHLGGGRSMLIVANNVENLRTRMVSECLSEHEIFIEAMRCSSSGGTGGFQNLGTLTSRLPERKCEGVRNFRGNGPEDARLIAIPSQKGHYTLILHNDYAMRGAYEVDGHTVKSRRAQFARLLQSKMTDQGELEVVLGPEVAMKLNKPDNLEKNWSPFVVDEDSLSSEQPMVYIHRYLEDSKGASVVIQVDLSTGNIVRQFQNPGNGAKLRKILGLNTFLRNHQASDPDYSSRVSSAARSLNIARLGMEMVNQFLTSGQSTRISGGTPAVRLNETHFLAVGHSLRTVPGGKGRDYRLFAYLFSSRPPFPIVASTPEFNFAPVDEAKMPNKLKFRDAVDFQVTTQFPIGLHIDKREGSPPSLFVSWGLDDRDTHLSVLPAEMLLSKMISLK